MPVKSDYMIDIVFLCILAYAAFKGLGQGLVMALFSLASVFIGLAAALKLSSSVAVYLERSDALPSRWMPVVAFLLVFTASLSVVRMVGRMLEKSLSNTMLGGLNRVGGVLVYCILYLLVYSVFLFYLDQVGLISDSMKSASIAYGHLKPWGPFALEGFGKLIPAFGDVFSELQRFFERVSTKMPA